MPANTPAEVQWFIYALADNGVISVPDGFKLFHRLPDGSGLEEYAQNVLDRLASELSEEEANEIVEQFQAIAEYAVEQAQNGEFPEFAEEDIAEISCDEEPAVSAVPATPAPQEIPSGHGGNDRQLGDKEAVHFDAFDIDYSNINSYADLPSLADTPNLSDAELAGRMIYLLSCLRHLGCSDLHISGGSMPFVRRQLQIERIDNYVLTEEDSFRLNTSLLSAASKEEFVQKQDMGYALEVGTCRFRVCLMQEKDGTAGSYRLVPDHICTLKELGFMDKDIPTIERLLDYNNGLILVTGPIGSGKTTTLASLIDIVNNKRQDHVITVEDPIEILQLSKGCQVTQREVGQHTASYSRALKAALREDPDVIVIGEMHDLETIENAITAAETGHLVIGTMHTGDAPNTLNRLLDVFPPAQQPQIRAMTAGSMRGIVCQQLIPDGFGGLTLIYEIMLNIMAVSNIISEGKAFQLKSTMSVGVKQGMCTMDQCIFEKYNQGLITYEAGRPYMVDSSTIAQMEQLYATREAQKLAALAKEK